MEIGVFSQSISPSSGLIVGFINSASISHSTSEGIPSIHSTGQTASMLPRLLTIITNFVTRPGRTKSGPTTSTHKSALPPDSIVKAFLRVIDIPLGVSIVRFQSPGVFPIKSNLAVRRCPPGIPVTGLAIISASPSCVSLTS